MAPLLLLCIDRFDTLRGSGPHDKAYVPMEIEPMHARMRVSLNMVWYH